MKALIIDDQQEKVKRLSEFLTSLNPTIELAIATNAQDGYRQLAVFEPSLILLDVVLPMNADAEPAEEGSLWFVKEVGRKRPGGKMPFIVGVTQYAESISSVQQQFRDYLWNVLYLSNDDNRWMEQLRNALAFSQQNDEVLKLNQRYDGIDVAIVTALRTPEFSELSDALDSGNPISVEETGEQWTRGKIRQRNGRELSVVAACAEEMGMVAMASLVTRLSISCAPNLLILVGITAGNKKRVDMSDLIVAESSWDCRAGKLTSDGFRADIKSKTADFKAANQLSTTIGEDFLIEFWKSRKLDRPPNIAKLHKGDVACSPSVVAAEGIFEELEDTQKRKVLGLEMEAYGCYDAAMRLGGIAPRVVSIKSVCDFGDGSKADKYQSYCAGLAAACVVEHLKIVTI